MQAWENELRSLHLSQGGADCLNDLPALSLAYRERTPANVAAADLAAFRSLAPAKALKVIAERAADGRVTWKIYHRGPALAMPRGIECLSRFGLQVVDYLAYDFPFADAGPCSLQHFVSADAPFAAFGKLAELAAALEGVLAGRDECDEFSQLAVAAGLSAREIMLLRALTRYWRQLGGAFAAPEVAALLQRRPDATRALIDCFHARFAPLPVDAGDPAQTEAACRERLAAAQAALTADDERQVFARLGELITAMLRTNFYQPDAAGGAKDYLSCKFDCAAIAGLPAPRPLYEIFVYSARMEGVHLRGGKVARGGIRWSDRLHDFRTEVHGLFKAQMVKNVVIVPEGAKGCFIVKQPPAEGGAALRAEAIACYSTLVRGLLDLTDNLRDGQPLPPAAVRCHDPADPYLVVAADKGTASFSDIANAISADYGFWLGDAFASGGSVGYDHKALGITARGAWEAVKRHCRELGLDTETTPIEVVGVGDMSGDVFGNGLLLGRGMRLIGAFDHRHIFVDPQPLAESGYRERQRLFALASSSWADFDPAALGPGGAIYPRSQAQLTLSAEAQARFQLPAEVSPEQLIGGLLRAETDLLWLGGIGTYVRATDESQAAAGDRANDAVRIAGRELRAKVVGEGANLGLTQRGRVEAALNGIALNTDAIDNAGGVSCSDHEVNIKILLAAAHADGRLGSEERRGLLAAMADEVCDLVLHDIRLQTQALSVAARRAVDDLDRHRRLISFFENKGQLERSVAGLPGDEELVVRRAAGRGLTRPELAVLLAHTKIALFGEFIADSLPDDPLLERDLVAYFPTPLRTAYADDIRRHPLRREIVTMAVVNSMVNRVGSGFVNDIQERTGAGDAEVARAYLIVRELFDLERCWAEIEAFDSAQQSASHLELLLATREIIELATIRLLRHCPSPLAISPTVAALRPLLAGHLAAADSPLVQRLENLRWLAGRLDIVLLAAAAGIDVLSAEATAATLAGELELPAFQRLLQSIPTRSSREASALACLLDLAAGAPARLLKGSLAGDPAATGGSALAGRQPALALYRARCRELERADTRDLAGAVLAANALRVLVADAA